MNLFAVIQLSCDFGQ